MLYNWDVAVNLQVYTYVTPNTVVHCYTPHFPVQDAAVALVLSEAVYKQLDAGGVEEATSAISPLMQELAADLHLADLRPQLLNIRWEQTHTSQRCPLPSMSIKPHLGTAHRCNATHICNASTLYNTGSYCLAN